MLHHRLACTLLAGAALFAGAVAWSQDPPDNGRGDPDRRTGRRPNRFLRSDRGGGDRPQRGGFGGRGPSSERIAERFDENNDGKITKDEFTGPEEMFARMDRNEDGVINADDFRGGFDRPGGGFGRGSGGFGGRGGQVGPDLSTIARSSDRDKLIDSILNPSREVAPQYVNQIVHTTDGVIISGLLIGNQLDGSVTITTTDARTITIPADRVSLLRPGTLSVMPDALESSLTVQDFRDLIAYLVTLK